MKSLETTRQQDEDLMPHADPSIAMRSSTFYREDISSERLLELKKLREASNKRLEKLGIEPIEKGIWPEDDK